MTDQRRAIDERIPQREAILKASLNSMKNKSYFV